MKPHLPTGRCTVTAPLSPRRSQWVQLLPNGEIIARDGRTWFADANAVVKATLAASQDRLPVDYEHQTDYAPKNGMPAPAAGWIVQLEARPDGVWGLVHWTGKASAMLSAREYRFISPVFHYVPETRKITKLLRAGLTNDPALEMTALARKEDEDMDRFPKSILDKLGLAATAGEEDTLNAIASLQNAAANPDPEKFVPIDQVQQMITAANEERSAAGAAKAEARVTEAIKVGTIPPALREWGISLCRKDPEAFDTFCQKTGTPYAHLFRSLDGDRVETSRKEEPRSRTEAAICSQLGVSPEDLR